MQKSHWSAKIKTKNGKTTTVGDKNWAKEMAQLRKNKKSK